ncbi:hypothetical protein CCAX7_61680 [Capsulimonas corticalis]|uniref:Uncharacterized protein n=1 Tax=Capsulimonas corticalis TaxID=2219043 RepID=A0A402CWG6_9BACT|nr:putative zinc-binding metallopeptidase [Capsulimonas corticalis]BDI34117.1 hypothetical protein CCAX7_61680 [Capsulimonas corticalis]
MSGATAVLNTFFDQYGISISTTQDTLPATVKLDAIWQRLSPTSPNDLSDTKAFGSWLIDEWSKYPKAWIKASDIQAVILGRALTATSNNAEEGVAEPNGIILYNLELFERSNNPEDYYRGLIHHEFDHEIEFGIRLSPDRPDGDWSAFNPTGFAYGKTSDVSAHPRQSFVTPYAETTIGEDKAEAYSYMFVNSRSKQLSQWVQADPGLAGKVTYYKAFIKNQVPIMDDAYFAAINP